MRAAGRFVLAAAIVLVAEAARAQPITIRAGTLLDGKGGVQSNVTIVVAAGRIVRIGANPDPVTYDLSRLTVLPGLIDTHVHIDAHFGQDGRAINTGETAAGRILHAAENAYVTLL